MNRAVPAAAAVLLSGLVALGAAAGVTVLVAALVLVVVAVATGWPGLLSLPTQRGSTTIIALCGAVAVAVVGFTEGEPVLRWLPVVLALSVIVAFWHQLLRRDMRPRLVESVTGVLSGVVAVELAAGWVGAAKLADGLDLILSGCAAVAASAVVAAVPWPDRVVVPLALLAGAGAAALPTVLRAEPAPVQAAAVGICAALVVVALDRLLAGLPTAGSRQTGVTIGATGVACAGTVVYLVSRVAG